MWSGHIGHYPAKSLHWSSNWLTICWNFYCSIYQSTNQYKRPRNAPRFYLVQTPQFQRFLQGYYPSTLESLYHTHWGVLHMPHSVVHYLLPCMLIYLMVNPFLRWPIKFGHFIQQCFTVTLYCIAVNTGKFSYLDYLEEKSLADGLIMANRY